MVHNLRNLEALELTPNRCNVFVGENGSGKTSLLESVFLLSRGKTFRHHQPKHYIAHEHNDCTVFARLTSNDTLAISKDKKALTTLRHNQNPVATQAPLTRMLPTLLIDPSSMAILDERAEGRRQLLDWLCFYCDREFHSQWLTYQKLLKQRNSLLKTLKYKTQSPAMYDEIKAWDSSLSRYAAALHAIRETIFIAWQASFDTMVTLLLPQYAKRLTLHYHPGYDTTMPLQHILHERLATDIDAGYTRIGIHRADITIYLTLAHKKELATHILSRGEKKLLITALKLAQLPLVCKQDKTPIVLIDDIGAELDHIATKRLIDKLASLPCQLFITSLDPDVSDYLTALAPADISQFDITNGKLTHQQ